MIVYECKRLLQNKALLCLFLICMAVCTVFIGIYSHEAEIDWLQSVFRKTGTVYSDSYVQALQKTAEADENELKTDWYREMLENCKADRTFYETYNASEIYEMIANLKTADGRSISPVALQLMQYKYAYLDRCIGRLQNDGTADDVYFDYATARIHTDLFVHFGTVVLICTCFFAVLCTLTCYWDDKLSNTQALVFASKKGRSLQKTKLFAPILISSAVYCLLTLFAYGLLFLKNDFTGIWEQSVASINNSSVVPDAEGPFVSWGSMTVGEYFVASLAVGYLVMLSFLLLAAAFGSADFAPLPTAGVLIALFAVVLLLIVSYFPNVNSILFYVLRMTGVGLVYYRGLWFSEGGFFTLIPYYETVSSLLCIFFNSMFFLLSCRYFKRKDL